MPIEVKFVRFFVTASDIVHTWDKNGVQSPLLPSIVLCIRLSVTEDFLQIVLDLQGSMMVSTPNIAVESLFKRSSQRR